MIDALVATEATEGQVFDDLFLTLRSPFVGAKTYPAACAEELRQQMEAAAEELTGIGVDPALWQRSPTVTTLADLANYALHIRATLPEVEDRIVLYLDPPAINDESDYGTQLGEFLRTELPEGIILMTVTYPGSEVHQTLQRYAKHGITFIEPHLNMDAAVEELLASGDPSDPATIFNKHYAAMAKYGNAGNFAKLDEEARAAIEFVDRQPGFEHLAVNVLCAEGAFLLPHKRRLPEAIDRFVKAQRRAKLAMAAGEPSAAVLLIQALNYEAGAHYQRSDYELATDRYRRAATEATQDEAHLYLRFESLRMAMESAHAWREYMKAYEYGLEALTVAEALPLEIVRQSTAGFMGRRLLKLAERRAAPRDIGSLRRRLETLLGPGWEDRVPPVA